MLAQAHTIAVPVEVRVLLRWQECFPYFWVGNIEALVITYTILGDPYYDYSTVAPKTLF